jgi:hypothetical protein
LLVNFYVFDNARIKNLKKRRLPKSNFREVLEFECTGWRRSRFIPDVQQQEARVYDNFVRQYVQAFMKDKHYAGAKSRQTAGQQFS